MKNTTSHAGTAALVSPEQSPTGFEIIRRPLPRLKLFTQILAATLREIFDESAYARFLNRRQLQSSRAAYAAFRQEYEAAKARRPKCC